MRSYWQYSGQCYTHSSSLRREWATSSVLDDKTHSSTLLKEYILMRPFWRPHWEYIGRRGISLSGSYQQGYSTAYNTQSHIKVVCNGYILTHILNWNPRVVPWTLPSMTQYPPCTIRGQRPICMHVRCMRVNITTFWHGFWLRGVQPLSGRW